MFNLKQPAFYFQSNCLIVVELILDTLGYTATGEESVIFVILRLVSSFAVLGLMSRHLFEFDLNIKLRVKSIQINTLSTQKSLTKVFPNLTKCTIGKHLSIFF